MMDFLIDNVSLVFKTDTDGVGDNADAFPIDSDKESEILSLLGKPIDLGRDLVSNSITNKQKGLPNQLIKQSEISDGLQLINKVEFQVD